MSLSVQFAALAAFAGFVLLYYGTTAMIKWAKGWFNRAIGEEEDDKLKAGDFQNSDDTESDSE